MVSHDCYICYMYINQTYAASTKQEFSYKKGQKLTVKNLGGGGEYSCPQTDFSCARPADLSKNRVWTLSI